MLSIAVDLHLNKSFAIFQSIPQSNLSLDTFAVRRQLKTLNDMAGTKGTCQRIETKKKSFFWSNPVPLPDLYFDSFSYPVASIVFGDIAIVSLFRLLFF